MGNCLHDVLADLRPRNAMSRWPDRETVTDDSRGVQLAALQEIARYWGADYDRRHLR
jgi:hypothetical protein